MNVYLAARYSRFPEMQEYRSDLRRLGLHVPARWVNGEHQMIDGHASHDQNVCFAQDDWQDFLDAEIFIGFTEDPNGEKQGRGRGGRHVEFGMALMRHRTERILRQRPLAIYIVGHRENVFHHLPEVRFYETWAECLREVARDFGKHPHCPACDGEGCVDAGEFDTRPCPVCAGYGVVVEGVPG